MFHHFFLFNFDFFFVFRNEKWNLLTFLLVMLSTRQQHLMAVTTWVKKNDIISPTFCGNIFSHFSLQCLPCLLRMFLMSGHVAVVISWCCCCCWFFVYATSSEGFPHNSNNNMMFLWHFCWRCFLFLPQWKTWSCRFVCSYFIIIWGGRDRVYDRDLQFEWQRGDNLEVTMNAANRLSIY